MFDEATFCKNTLEDILENVKKKGELKFSKFVSWGKKIIRIKIQFLHAEEVKDSKAQAKDRLFLLEKVDISSTKC